MAHADDLAWGGFWYFNVGAQVRRYPDGTNRSWEDNRDLGFVSAGRLPKSSREILRLSRGAKIYAYLNSAGYVGLGELTSDPVPARELILENGVPLIDAKLRETSLLEYVDSPAELREYAATVHWTKTFSADQAKKYQGIVATPAAACKLSDVATLQFLEQEFGIGTDGHASASSLRAEDAEVHIGMTHVLGKYKAYIVGYLPNGSSRRWVEVGGGSTRDNLLRLPHQREGFDSAYEATQFALHLFDTQSRFVALLAAHTGHQNLSSSANPPVFNRLLMPWEDHDSNPEDEHEPHRLR